MQCLITVTDLTVYPIEQLQNVHSMMWDILAQKSERIVYWMWKIFTGYKADYLRRDHLGCGCEFVNLSG